MSPLGHIHSHSGKHQAWDPWTKSYCILCLVGHIFMLKSPVLYNFYWFQKWSVIFYPCIFICTKPSRETSFSAFMSAWTFYFCLPPFFLLQMGAISPDPLIAPKKSYIAHCMRNHNGRSQPINRIPNLHIGAKIKLGLVKSWEVNCKVVVTSILYVTVSINVI